MGFRSVFFARSVSFNDWFELCSLFPLSSRISDLKLPILSSYSSDLFVILFGYNGSQLWDVVFSVQAIVATNLVDEYRSMLHKAHDFIKNSQVKKNSSGNIQSWYRHISRGGWPFSTPDNGWPVSDCTAEALKTVLMLSQMPHDIVGEAIARECLYDAVYLLLTLQAAFNLLIDLNMAKLIKAFDRGSWKKD
ncbi:hypothetical protein LXL04_019343 [Taraxacum kok-saghyz]